MLTFRHLILMIMVDSGSQVMVMARATLTPSTIQPKPNGISCSQDSECTNFCIQGTCSSQCNNGNADGRFCTSSNCDCRNICNHSMNKCVEAFSLANGERCDDKSVCRSNLCGAMKGLEAFGSFCGVSREPLGFEALS